ncbi:MAG TPA: hypothetical protein ENK16_07840, partial [Chromatiales bacterium]|nr:hypothetical protein [Chromatiales bacterium]
MAAALAGQAGGLCLDLRISCSHADSVTRQPVTAINRRVVLSRPLEGVPEPEDFRVESVEPPALADNEVRVRHEFLSLDPYQRSAIAGRHAPHDRPLGAGDMPPAETVGRVIESQSVFWKPGD